MASVSNLHNAPIVLDNGSGTIRAGFAGSDLPSTHFPSYVGRPKHPRVLAGALEGDVFIGKRAQELRGLLKLRWPLEHGIVTDWDDMERIWQFVWERELATSSENHPVLLTEPPLNPRTNRDTAAQILFEKFDVPALYLAVQATLSLYAAGRTTGTVLDVGDGVSHAVPVYEGFAVPSAIRRADVAGRDVTEYLQNQLLRKAGFVFHTSAEKEIVRHIKEKVTYLAQDPRQEEKEWSEYRPLYVSSKTHTTADNDKNKNDLSNPATATATTTTTTNNEPTSTEPLSARRTVEYTLPDNRKIKIGPERFRAPEILFQPDIIGTEYPGVAHLLTEAIQRTDLDLRKALYGNIVLSGGGTLTKGFGERLLAECQRLAVRDTRIKIFAPPERRFSTWIGGSILAGLSTFRKVSYQSNLSSFFLSSPPPFLSPPALFYLHRSQYLLLLLLLLFSTKTHTHTHTHKYHHEKKKRRRRNHLR